MSGKDRIARQIAALPLSLDRKGNWKVLMVTSRDSGRWVMPKGWEMNGRKPWHAAEIEALEEAGAIGTISPKPIGRYHYKKGLPGAKSVQCCVTLYPMRVEKLNRRWKERKQRKRRWFSPAKAAQRVDEPELRDLLQDLEKRLSRGDLARSFG